MGQLNLSRWLQLVVVFFPFALSLSLLLSLQTRVLPLKIRPNQGIRLTVRMALVASVAACPLLLYAALLRIFGGYHPPSDAPDTGVLSNSFAVQIFRAFFYIFLIFGGFDLTGHYSLRLILALRGDLPFNAVRFLDQAADQIFLRKVGGGYIFIHRLILEYFARDAEARLLRRGTRAQQPDAGGFDQRAPHRA